MSSRPCLTWRRGELDALVLDLLTVHPVIAFHEIARTIGCSISTAQRVVGRLRSSGLIQVESGQHGEPGCSRSVPNRYTVNPATWSVRTANDFCRDAAHAREGLWRALVEARRRWSESVTRAEQDAPTLRPQAVNAQVEGASSDYGSEVELRAEWAQLVADWGIGGWVNAADEILKRAPHLAPPGAIEAGWRLLDLLEWIGMDNTDPRSFEAWRAEP